MGQCLLLKGGAKRLGKIVLFDGSNGGRNPDYPITARPSTSSLAIDTNEIKITKASTNTDVWARTTNKIDVTNLKLIHMLAYCNPRDARYNMELYVGDGTADTWSSKVIGVRRNPPDNAVMEITCNVETLVGSYYLYAGGNGGAAYLYMGIQKWWCE